jgi:hypothetical protein
VNEKAQTDHGQHDEAERQVDDDDPVTQQCSIRDPLTVQEQERRQEQHEESFGVEILRLEWRQRGAHPEADLPPVAAPAEWCAR